MYIYMYIYIYVYVYICMSIYGQDVLMDLITTSLSIQEGIPMELPFSTPLPLIFTFLIGQPSQHANML